MANKAYTEKDLEPVLSELDRQIKKHGSCYIKQLCNILEPKMHKREQTIRNLIDFGVVNGFIEKYSDLADPIHNRQYLKRKTKLEQKD